MPTEKEALDYLGEFLMKNYRDRALSTLEKAFKGDWESKSLQDFQDNLQSLSSEQQEKLFDGFEHIISGALHDLLFNLQEENHFKNRIKLLVDGYNVVKISDGIHGEQHGKDGWIEKFSEYKEKQ
ncbi:MAG: hypothetical protein ABI904_22115 [Chloroflexota bacterium]